MKAYSIYRNNGHILPKIWVKILRSGVQWPHKKYSEIVLTTLLMPLYPTVCSKNWEKVKFSVKLISRKNFVKLISRKIGKKVLFWFLCILCYELEKKEIKEKIIDFFLHWNKNVLLHNYVIFYNTVYIPISENLLKKKNGWRVELVLCNWKNNKN